MSKFLNCGIVGNRSVVCSFSDRGELLRFCFPWVDGRQFVDYFRVGVKVNDSGLIFLHEDVNNVYSQRYIDDTNILVSDIKNTYFSLKVEQTDCVLIRDNVLVKKYVFENENCIDLDVKFVVDSKILAGSLENFGSRIFDGGVVQYNHNYVFSVFSDEKIFGHRLNDVQSVLSSAVLEDKDYIGMSNEVAVSYDLGVIRPNEKREFYLYISVFENGFDVEKRIENILSFDVQKEIDETEYFWKKYVDDHRAVKLRDTESDFNSKIMEIYNRSILLYPLLINYNTGGIAAALEVDENRVKSGGYCYCWPRDAIFITRAFDLLKMEKEAEAFYNKFCRMTQCENGMWEQRFFTDGILAPCWGYQIDETASVVYGVYNHFEHTKDCKFLEDNLKTCEKAIKFLISYVENVLDIDEVDIVKKELKEKYKKSFEAHKQVSYDLWEMNEGVHLYSLSSIIASFESMKKIYEALDNKDEKNARLKKEKRNNLVIKLNKYIVMLKDFIKTNLIDKDLKILKRNLTDNNMDISVIGAVYPFDVFDTDEKVVRNTVDKINMTLRTYTNGYLRFESDNYMGGNNPWVITTLWMALYYIKSGDIKSAEECFKYVVNTASKHGFLAEQVNNEDPNFKWVVGLGWSHAMFIIVLDELIKSLDKKEG